MGQTSRETPTTIQATVEPSGDLSIMFVFRRTDRITRPVSKTVAVKTTSYEFLLLNRPSFRSRFPFSAATAAQG